MFFRDFRQRESYYIFADAKKAAQYNANRDGIKWAVFFLENPRNSMYMLYSEHESPFSDNMTYVTHPQDATSTSVNILTEKCWDGG